jgi:hypothetical protein
VYPLDAGGNVIASGTAFDLVVYRFTRAGSPLVADAWSKQVIDDAVVVFPTLGITNTYNTNNLTSSTNAAIADVELAPGISVVEVVRSRNLQNVNTPSSYWIEVEWLGEGSGGEPRCVTLYDTTSAANTALDTGTLELEDAEAITVTLSASGAMAAAPILTLSEITDIGAVVLARANAVVAAGSLFASQTFALGASVGIGVTAAAPGVTPPRVGKLTLQAAGAGVTVRMVVTTRRALR